MKNFIYNIPTKVYFGKHEVENLRAELEKFGNRVLLVYGKGSIKRNGVYDEVKQQLQGFTVQELCDVDANPTVDDVKRGLAVCREHPIDVVLAVGGGSVVDCAKAICAGAFYDGDVWDLIMDSSKIKQAIPLCSVITLSATGSEMNANSVITNTALKYKKGFASEVLIPKVSILDPRYAMSVSKYQTAAGVADIMSHIFEVYFNHDDPYISDSIALVLLKTCVIYGPIAYAEPHHYEARANLMWASSLAINGLIALGSDEDWSCHTMEHVLSGYYNVTHGAGLAMLTPAWMRFVLDDDSLPKFARYGIEVFGIDPTLDPWIIAEQAISETHHFYASLGLPLTCKELGIPSDKLDEMAQFVADTVGGVINGYRPLSKDDILHIYENCNRE